MQNDIVKPPKPSSAPKQQDVAVVDPTSASVQTKQPSSPIEEVKSVDGINAPQPLHEDSVQLQENPADQKEQLPSDELAPQPKTEKPKTSSGNGFMIGLAVFVCVVLVAVAIFLQLQR